MKTSIVWNGNNLKEVIDFTGRYYKFDQWFKSWEEYENYVHSHDDIFKLFVNNYDYYEIYVGCELHKDLHGEVRPITEGKHKHHFIIE